MATKHVISVSGGKDSTAVLLLALERCPPGSVVPIFCDTGNEHQAVYDYLAYLEQALGVTIHRLRAEFSRQLLAKRMFIARDVRAGRDKTGRRLRWSNKAKRRALAVMHPSGNPFLDLCMWKGRFPSRMAQFCTEELKRNMAVGFQLELMDAGHCVISWQGVRRDESQRRRNAKKAERVAPRLRIFRPIVDWTAAQVFDLAASRCVQPNPLYLQGMGRVGCMPCINCGKDELRQIAVRWPEHIERIAEWERIVSMCSKRGYSTFMADAHNAQDRRQVFADLHIWSRIEWAKTTRGGRQYDLLAGLDEPTACASAYGLCE
ncbi:phosphoadenosine phosphosulfate reductase family protein [Delftia acidovorans]|uniref:phosphoadenosine phosphosulfate reductase domain-containing protein n=1 Tax=Delftia acidovorans TaxID=80866 RepID=UPI000BCD4F63|nr:phosphoadenosine phosphosulfate reductase family protein [Delftia acidovorans]SOE35858.1 3'-phosphoadenosine 5'-phosphosulfate sulfotransferase (PAPS reductase)/FAD synthetase [Delftia acidovorans]